MNIFESATSYLRYWIAVIVLTSFFSATALAQKHDTVFIKQKPYLSDKDVYKIDTVLFGSPSLRHILIGTTMLPMTHNRLKLMNYGLTLEKITPSACSGAMEGTETADINSIAYTDSTLTIDVKLTDNCCFSFLCDASIDSTSTVHLICYGYGNYCGCNCCYGITYHFKKKKELAYSSVKGIMINDDRKTFKQIKK